MRTFPLAIIFAFAPLALYAEGDSAGREYFDALVIMAPEHPLIVRLDVLKKDGQSERRLDEAWREGTLAEFRQLDADNSGDLSNDEMSKAAWIRSSTQNSLSRRTGLSGLLSKILAASDGAEQEVKVSRSAYVRRKAQREPWVKLRTTPASLIQVDRLWQLADRSQDQQLDADELAGAAHHALKLDVNANRLLERNELRAIDNPLSANQTNTTMAYNGKVQRLLLSRRLGPDDRLPPWEELPTSTNQKFNMIEDLASRLASTYQKVEFTGRWLKLLQQYDGTASATKDGKLDAMEWGELLRDGPQVDAHCKVLMREATVNDYVPQPVGWSNQPDRDGGFRLVAASLHEGVEAFRSGSGVFLRGAGAIIRFNVPPPAYDPLQNIDGSFELADGDKNEYLELKEAQRYYPINIVFSQADADGDGKLFKKELDKFVKDVERQRGLTAEIVVNEQGRMLFPVLDSNGDQALDVRERKDFPAMLAELDDNADGALSSDELPVCYEIGVKHGLPSFMTQFSFEQPIVYGYQPQGGKSQDGPEWFSLIDRNKDGYLQREEYPGKSERFKKMDANGDGLVTALEAADQK